MDNSPQGASFPLFRGQCKGIRDVFYPDVISFYQNSHYIEAVSELCRTETVNPNLGRPAQLQPFPVMDRLNRAPKRLAAPSFHFDERDFLFASHDEIDVATSCTKAMIEY